MSGNARTRSSKWDLREDLESKQRPPCSSRDGHRHNGSKWAYLEKVDKISSEHDMEFSSKENCRGSRILRKGDIINKNSRIITETSMEWDRDHSYDTRMSPGLEEWRNRSCSQSPKNIWRCSVRSRSRSNERGYRRDMGVHDRMRSRSGASAQTCRDSVAGKCRRGSHCHFLHDGDKFFDENRETRYMTNGTSRYVHHGFSDGLSQGVVDELHREREFDRRNTENPFERVRQDPGRSVDTPCKFFAAGHCHNGKFCQFSHDKQRFASPKGRFEDERLGHNRSDREQVWNQLRRSDTSSPKSSPRDGKHELGHNTVDVNRVRNVPTWDEVGAGSKAAKMEDSSETVDPSKSGSTAWPLNDQWDHKLEDNTKVAVECITESGKKGSRHWEMQDASASMSLPGARGADKWISDVDMSPDWYCRFESTEFVSTEQAHSKINLPGEATYLASNDHDRSKGLTGNYIFDALKPTNSYKEQVACDNMGAIAVATASHCEANLFLVHPGQSFSENRQLLAAGIHEVGKDQAIVPDIPSNGNYLEGSLGKVGYVYDKGSIRPDVRKSSPMQANSTIPPTQITVGSDQLSRLANLSVSPVHLLGKGQQLPQLFLTLNSHNSASATSFGNTGGPLERVSPNIIQPDDITGLQKQHDPMCNMIEIKNTDASFVSSTSIHNSVGQKDVSAENLERPSLTSISDKLSGSHNVGNSEKWRAAKSEQMIKAQLVKQCEITTENNIARMDGGRTVQDDNKKGKENFTSGNMERDGGTDVGKKTKDAKVIRAFKFSLVECVKELMKPIWKEGKITKEDYKTIVKKVVDKVTGSLQANHIPQTQEKIDQYLSCSKAKLNKLVQAYMEKVQKT